MTDLNQAWPPCAGQALETLEIDTLVVGAGQAGVAMSEHLSALGVPHLVLERNRIAEAWRTGRWDSLVANGPAWHDRFPNLEFDDVGPDVFPPKERMARYFDDYARMIDAPIRTGVEVRRVTRCPGRPGFIVETSEGDYEAQRVVAATGPFQVPSFPQIVPQDAGVMQIHSSDYRNPEQLPAGAVLVVGGGASGCQIAEELKRAGREVYLSIGEHYRPPRSYRNRDYVWWLGGLRKWDEIKTTPKKKHVAFAVSGYDGGRTVDFRNVVLIMTSNAGAAEQAKAAIGFGRDRREGEDTAAIERTFTPEFRNRLDAVISFAPLPKEVILQVVEKFVLQLEAQLLDRNVHIELTRPAAEWLGEKGYDEKMGARPLGRVIQENIKKPLAEELLFGKLSKGGVVKVGVKDGKIELRIDGPAQKRLSGDKPPLLTAD